MLKVSVVTLLNKSDTVYKVEIKIYRKNWNKKNMNRSYRIIPISTAKETDKVNSMIILLPIIWQVNSISIVSISPKF